VVLLLLPCLFLWPALIGRAVLLPLDNLLAMQPWRSLLPGIDPGFTTPHNALIGDMIVQNLGWKRFLAVQLRHGHLPLWNPDMLGGAPFLAAGQYQVLYPLGAFFLLLPAAWAYGPYTALHLALAGIFTFGYLRLIGERRPGALVGAIAFAFCGSLVTSILWPQMIGGMVWLPAVLACIELVRRDEERPGPVPHSSSPHLLISPSSRRLLAVVVGALAIALQILAGHLEISFYVLFTTAAYAAWRLAPLFWRRTWRAGFTQTGILLLMGLLGIGLAGAQLLPFVEAISRNFREGSATLADVRGWALPLRQIVAYVVPDCFGNPAQHQYLDLFSGHVVPVGTAADGSPTSPPRTAFWGIKNYVEAASYVGIVPLLLAPLGLFGRRNRYAAFFGIAAVVALLLAFGTPLYGVLFRLVPGFGQIHTAFRWVYVYSFAVAVLAALGTNWLLEQAARPRPALGARLYAAAALTGGAAALAAALGVFALKNRIAQVLQGRIAADAARPKPWFLAAQLHDGREWLSLIWAHCAWAALVLFLGAALLVLVLALRKRPVLRRTVAYLFPAIVVIDLFVVNGSFNTMADPHLLGMVAPPNHGQPAATIPPSLATLQALAQSDPPFRIASFGPEDVLPPNTAMLYGLQDVRGYDTIVLKRYAAYLNLIEPQLTNLNLYSQTTKTFQNAATLHSPLFRLLGVRYVLSSETIPGDDVQLVSPGPINVYAVPAALPRAFLVGTAQAVRDESAALAAVQQPGFDPARQVIVEGPPALAMTGGTSGGAVRITNYAADSVALDVTTTGPGYLVLADTYFPSWTAQVRPMGEPDAAWQQAAVLPADEAFRAIRLAPGHWTVQFRYQPLSFRTGLVISSLAGGVLLLLLAAAGWGSLGRRLDWQGTAARRVAKNIVSPMLSNFTNKLLDFGFNIFTAALIGPSGIGRYAEAVSIYSILATLQDFGLGTITVRDVASDRNLAARYFKNTLVVRWLLAVAVLPLAAAVAAIGWRLRTYDEQTLLALGLLVAGFFPGSLASAASAHLRANENFETASFVEVAGNLLRILIGTFTLLLGWNILGLALTSLIVNLFSALMLAGAVRASTLWREGALDGVFCRYLVRESFTLMLNNMLNLAFFRLDVILLSFLTNASAVGYYSVAYKFIDGVGFVSAYLTGALFPVMSRLARESLVGLRELYLFALRLLIAIALPVMAVMLVLADRIIELFYPQFPQSIAALRILILFLPFSYVNGVTQYALIAVDKQRRITKAFVAGVVFNVVANVIFIPHFGINAAAAVTVLSEVVLLVPFLSGMWPLLKPLPLAQLTVRPALAALGAGVVALALHRSPFILALPAAMATYPILLLLFGGLPAAERRQLANLFARRPVQVGEAG
jgi:O-antigen/teichoic acid export membrane protein